EVVRLLPLCDLFRRKRERRPEVYAPATGHAFVRKLKVGGHDTDNTVSDAVELQGAPQHVGPSAEAPLPEIVTQHGDGLGLRAIEIGLFGKDQAAEQRLGANHWKQVRRHTRRAAEFGSIQTSQGQVSERVSGNIVKALILGFVIEIFGSFGAQALHVELLKVAPEQNQMVGLFVRQRSQQHRIDNTKDCGVYADADR